MSNREEAGLETGFEIEFGQKPDNVRSGSFRADRKSLPDRSVVEALGEQGQDLELAGCQLFQRRLHFLDALALRVGKAKERDDLLSWLHEFADADTPNREHDIRGMG